MMRAARLFVVAAAIVAAHVVMRAAGLAEHTSLLAGMPRSGMSLVLGPAYVLVHLAAVIVAPIVALAAAADAALARLGLAPAEPSAGSRQSSSSSSANGPSSSSSS